MKGNWHVPLDKASYLTTFNIPSGRFRFTRLPFGLFFSQDAFQKQLDCARHICPWFYRSGTWQKPHQPHEERTRERICVQQREVVVKDERDQLLRSHLDIPRSENGQEETISNLTNESPKGREKSPELPRSCQLPVQIFKSIGRHCGTTSWLDKEGCAIHMVTTLPMSQRTCHNQSSDQAKETLYLATSICS